MNTTTGLVSGAEHSRVTWSDVLVAGSAFAVAAMTAALAATRDGEAPFTVAAAATLAAQAAPLVLRRRYPIAVLAVVGTIAAIYGWVDWADPLLPVPLIVALVSVFERCPRRYALVVLAISCVAGVAATALAGDSDPADWGVAVLVLVLSPIIGELLRARREELLGLESRNAALGAERERAITDARLLERRRIARELHDVVTHNVTLLVVQAEAAAGTPSMSESERVAAFDALADGGREALVELRQLLGVLRDPNEATPSAPTAGIGQVADLVTRARLAGLDVDYRGPDARPALPAAVDLAAYRVVQEGLTNVVRHASAQHAVVTVDLAPDEVVITIDDDGVGGNGVEGVGLTGLRERVGLLGGAVDAAPRPMGGFRLLTRIPLSTTP